MAFVPAACMGGGSVCDAGVGVDLVARALVRELTDFSVAACKRSCGCQKQFAFLPAGSRVHGASRVRFSTLRLSDPADAKILRGTRRDCGGPTVRAWVLRRHSQEAREAWPGSHPHPAGLYANACLQGAKLEPVRDGCGDHSGNA